MHLDIVDRFRLYPIRTHLYASPNRYSNRHTVAHFNRDDNSTHNANIDTIALTDTGLQQARTLTEFLSS